MATSSGDKFDEDVQHHRRHNHHQGRLHQHKRSTKRLRTRPRDFQSECLVGYRERIEFHCRFPNTDKPCLREHADADSARQLDVLATDCCAAGGLCTVDDIEALCCRTMDCLAKCYGPSFTAQIQSRFRYADILLRAHPNAEGRSNKIGRRMKKRGGKEWGEEAEDD
uniref:Uncharacterized protein n=1 Tax=Globodera rostochiensis TaxID=31243 RepID=A0A914HX09_GLORO